ncbi:class I SAM-dependent methyltransferase [Rhodobacterales bacterium HKCCE3408]|nr:class I SAM-dependent methyltransferase [Rhodobacterales bacterium HKCCE3408]
MGESDRQPATFAENYDSVLVPVIFRPWAQELIRRAGPKDGEDILDLACGTGAVTREVAGVVKNPGSLTGADHSAGMLAVARAMAEAVGIEADWVEADAGALPFDDDSFDLVLCQQALQFFPDRAAALSETRRVLKPGGRIAACIQRSIDLNPLLAAQSAALDRFVGTSAGDAVRAICGWPGADAVRAAFEAAGFAAISVQSVTLTLHHPDARAFAAGAMGGMHTGNWLSQASEADRTACIDAFLDGLGPHCDGTSMTVPHVSNVVTATA